MSGSNEVNLSVKKSSEVNNLRILNLIFINIFEYFILNNLKGKGCVEFEILLNDTGINYNSYFSYIYFILKIYSFLFIILIDCIYIYIYIYINLCLNI